MTSQWIQSLGGPLLLLPAELLSRWSGTEGSDYERACAIDDEIAEIEVGSGFGLVLGDEPHRTAWATADDGAVLVRWIHADSEAGVWEAIERMRDSDFGAISLTSFVVGPSGRCILLDAVDCGDDLRNEHLERSLMPGVYSVDTTTLAPSERTRVLVHRLRLTSRQSR